MSYQDYSDEPRYRESRRYYGQRHDSAAREDDLRTLCRKTLRRANQAMTPSSSRHWMIFAAGVVVGLILG